jgi:hypothetical protein
MKPIIASMKRVSIDLLSSGKLKKGRIYVKI